MTTEELIKKTKKLFVPYYNDTEIAAIAVNDVQQLMLEFAKHNVEEALTAACAKGEARVHGTGSVWAEIEDDSILNSYPLENIE